MSTGNPVSVCTICYFIGEPKIAGSGLIEFVLWLFCAVPGLIYHIWRRGNRKACPQCGATGMIPVDTPRAQEIVGVSEKQKALLQERMADAEKRTAHGKRVDWFIYCLLAGFPLIFIIIYIRMMLIVG